MMKYNSSDTPCFGTSCLGNLVEPEASNPYVKIGSIVNVKTVPREYYPPITNCPPGPFHTNDDPELVRYMYWIVFYALKDRGYYIYQIERKPYVENYYIADYQGYIYLLGTTYNKEGVVRPFKYRNVPNMRAEYIEYLINNTRIPYKYEPSDANLAELYNNMTTSCETCNIYITNIVEHLDEYRVVYYLRTAADFTYLNFNMNAQHQITYITPHSTDLNRDPKLVKLLDILGGRNVKITL